MPQENAGNTTDQILFESAEKFIEALTSRGVKRIAYAIIDELRAIETTPGCIEVKRVQAGEAIAYHESIIFKLVVHDEAVNNTAKYLSESGIDVIRRNRNIISHGKKFEAS